MDEDKQTRSALTREALLEALIEELDARPAAEVSLADVATRAGVTTGAVYARFGSKVGLLAAAHRRQLEQAERRMASWAGDPRWAAASPAEIVQTWVRGASTFAMRRTPVLRLGLALDDPGIAAQKRHTLAFSIEVLERLLSCVVSIDEEQRRQLGLSVWAAHALMAQRPFLEPAPPIALDDDQFHDALTDLICRAIGVQRTRPAARRSTGPSKTSSTVPGGTDDAAQP